MRIEGLYAGYGGLEVLKGISLSVPEARVIAIMGPSGCGKSTLIRCINRLHELVPGAYIRGRVLLRGKDLFRLDATEVRSRIGMVFQRPNPFPTMSIYENVAAGYILNGKKPKRRVLDAIVEDALRKAFLWDEVKDRLHSRGTFLSGGQQQRLCIARALAMKPEVLLMDEPTSALDPKATAMIERLICELKRYMTVLVVTHNAAQAARISDYTAFLYMGKLVEFGPTERVFTAPRDKRTEAYLTGRFG